MSFAPPLRIKLIDVSQLLVESYEVRLIIDKQSITKDQMRLKNNLLSNLLPKHSCAYFDEVRQWSAKMNVDGLQN